MHYITSLKLLSFTAPSLCGIVLGCNTRSFLVLSPSGQVSCAKFLDNAGPGLIHGSGASDAKHEKSKRTITKPLAHVDWARVECWTAVFYAVSMASVELESL